MGTYSNTVSSIPVVSTWTVTRPSGVSSYVYSNVQTGVESLIYDISSIPTGAQITNVSFTYNTNYSRGGSPTCTLYANGKPATNGNILDFLNGLEGVYDSLRFTLRYKAAPGSSGVSSASSATCYFTSLCLMIQYIAGSNGTLNKTVADAGSSIILSLTLPENVAQTDTVTHTVVWTFGSHTKTDSLASGVLTDTLSIPVSWLDAIPNAMTGTASCALTTYVTPSGGTQENRGTVSLGFAIAAPASAAPTVSMTIAATSDLITGTAYYRYLSKAKLTPSASTVGGASIVSSYLTGTDGSNISSNSGLIGVFTTQPFQVSGTQTFTLHAVDSRGLSGTATVTCSVTDVALPAISAFSVSRYATIDGVRTNAGYGDKVWITANFTYDRAGGKNTCTAYILYGHVGTTDAQKTRVNITPTTTGYSCTDNYSLISATISADYAWEFDLYVSDKAHSLNFRSRISTGRCNLHLSGSDYGVAIGRFSDATVDDPKFQVQYPSTFYNGIYDANGVRLDFYSETQITSVSSTFTVIDTPVLCRAGRCATLAGNLKPAGTLTSNATSETLMFTIPEGYRPGQDVYAICQGNTYYIWTVHLKPDGGVYFSKYRSGSSYSSGGTSTTLQFNLSWITAG